MQENEGSQNPDLQGEAVAETAVEAEQAAVGQRVQQLRGAAEEVGTAEGQAMPLQELQDDAVPVTATLSAAEIQLDSLMDVPVTLSVEIGRCRMPIKQLVSLNQGSVIELDRAVSDPLDLLVNGMLIARGEVVVANGQFGLRLIDVVSQSERLKKLK